jgi:hypothetical protein
MEKNPLAAHACDELGISEITTARPVQAALTSAVMFSVGAAMPLLMVIVAPINMLVPVVSAASLGFLAVLGAVGAKAGGASILRADMARHILGSFGPRNHRRDGQAVRHGYLMPGEFRGFRDRLALNFVASFFIRKASDANDQHPR